MPRRLLAGLSVMLVLAGCGGGPQPKIAAPTETSSVLATPNGSGVATPTTGPESAEDFARRWSRANDDMQNSGAATEYRNLTRGCRPCKVNADVIEGYYAAGGFVRYRGGTVDSVQRKPSDSAVVLDLRVNEGPTEYKTAGAAELLTLPGGHTTYRLTLGGAPGAWRVRNVVIVDR